MAREGVAAEKDAVAPDADDSRKAKSPTGLSRSGWLYSLKKAGREFGRDQCSDLAAGLTYYAVLSLFPALLALVSLVGVFGQGETTTQALLDIVRDLGQGGAAKALEDPIRQIVESQAAGFALVAGVVGALWTASNYVNAFSRAMNRVYQVDEGRPMIVLRAKMLALTFALIIMAGLMLIGFALSGGVAEAIGGALGFGETAVTIWGYAKIPVMLILLMVMVALLYYLTPNIQQPKIRWVSPGALMAIMVCVLASVAFGFYVSNFGSYNRTYGSLAGVIVFLLWLYIINSVLLLGAEFDSELERTRQLEAGIRAERELQLPPRATSASEKAAEKFSEDVEEGRRIRLEAQLARGESIAADAPQPR
ncbi:YihY/virulence factor BrkB family protein [Janibacter sp. GXQ6167]|uniref:YihY/virulence factor BrkB family protein n=1 Tax=Janibacter sp. GXQ6167 TaxID=3240791 RepID=UPI0035244A94